MDAVKFLKEKRRMCEWMCNSLGCNQCPMSSYQNKYALICVSFGEEHPEEVVAIVEKWGKEHPIITNKDKLKEMFGEICTEKGELVFTDPNWWMAEYKEPKGE